PTVIVLMVFLASAYLADGVRVRVARAACSAIVLLCVIYGFLMAEGSYRFNLPYNQEQAVLATWFSKVLVSPDDLVITQFDGAYYDACEFITVLSRAEVLYCRNAQLSLSTDQNREIQRPREVLYLYFHGKTREWFETAEDFEKYGLYGELQAYRGE